MDGSTIVIPSAAPPSGLTREDALFRIVYYGEALRAITEHVNDTLISGACGPMIAVLDDAFDTLSETRDTFGPEEFTLFVMSRMLGHCDTPDAAREFQVGAATYILKSADALPAAYQPVISDAQRMLGKPVETTVPSVDGTAQAHQPSTDDQAPVQSLSVHTHQVTPHQRAIDTPTPAQQNVPVATPEAGPVATHSHTEPEYRLRRSYRSLMRRTLRRIKRVIVWCAAVGVFMFVGLVGLGAVDPVELVRSILDVVTRVLR